MIKNILVKKSNINKKGVFANYNFKKGEIVIQWKSNKVLTKTEVNKLSPTEKHYISNYTPDEYLLQQSPERFVNHSCNPNTKVINNCDVAIKNIKKGDEITSDYSIAHIQQHFYCRCNCKNCRKYI